MSSSGQFAGLRPWRYHVERPSGKPPSELSYAGIADVTVMSSGKVAVIFRSDPAVLVFKPDGAVAARWSKPEIVAGTTYEPARACDGRRSPRGRAGRRSSRRQGAGFLPPIRPPGFLCNPDASRPSVRGSQEFASGRRQPAAATPKKNRLLPARLPSSAALGSDRAKSKRVNKSGGFVQRTLCPKSARPTAPNALRDRAIVGLLGLAVATQESMSPS
jgi:hypothetical protein